MLCIEDPQQVHRGGAASPLGQTQNKPEHYSQLSSPDSFKFAWVYWRCQQTLTFLFTELKMNEYSPPRSKVALPRWSPVSTPSNDCGTYNRESSSWLPSIPLVPSHTPRYRTKTYFLTRNDLVPLCISLNRRWCFTPVLGSDSSECSTT